jgi:hypothetical protein
MIYRLVFALTFLPGFAFAAVAAPALVPGLLVAEYPRHARQTDEDHVKLDVDQMGEPIGETYVVESLKAWQWDVERNAVAQGYLIIDVDGDYAFNTNSFYDRNLLMIDDKVVCGFGDGGGRVATLPLKKGRVSILSVGYVEGRGNSEGIKVRWRPPGQAELSEIPPSHLLHFDDGHSKPKRVETSSAHHSAIASSLRAAWLTTVTKDFVVEAYKNGVRIPDTKRKLLLDRFGASVERIQTDVRAGDWLVFHVVHNRMRHGGTKFFAVAGCLAENKFGFVSDPESKDWSICDDPARSREFIRNREDGTEARAVRIAKPWSEGAGFMLEYAGSAFTGKPLWGAADSTWIKVLLPEDSPPPTMIKKPLPIMNPLKADAPKVRTIPPVLAIISPKRWPVQILFANYGTGGKDADVTAKVKEYVEEKQCAFYANPPHLGADPNPYWNKSLHVIYIKDGVRREQWRNENEYVLPESFYGPQDAAELMIWLHGTRWFGLLGEIQFHPDRTLTGAGVKGSATWETLGNSKLRITWPDDKKVEFQCDYTWANFSAPEDGKNTYRLLR